MGATKTYTLMCRDHEAVRLGFDSETRTVVWRTVLDGRYAPLGTLDRSGTVTRPGLERWIVARGIPLARPQASAALKAIGTSSPSDLMLQMRGASLSDCYWFRGADDDAKWGDVNFFEHGFSSNLGLALAGSSDSSEGAVGRIKDEGLLAHRSPDAAVNGNLPKRWVILPDGIRALLKSGKPGNLFMEPVNEVAASKVCGCLLEPDEYVPYRLVDNPAGIPAYLSSCPCFVAPGLEFVTGHDVMASVRKDNSASLYERFARECERRGLGKARKALSKMLAIDHLIDNWDRHWGNFGILMNAETREWLGMAPLFDMGESLWCDRITSGRVGTTRHMPYRLPFSRRVDTQLRRYAEDLGWVDPEGLRDIPDIVVDTLGTRQMADLPDAWLAEVRQAVMSRCDDIRKAQVGRAIPVALSLSRLPKGRDSSVGVESVTAVARMSSRACSKAGPGNGREPTL